MEGSDYKTKYEILKRAQEAIGIPIGEIDKTGRIKTGKGAIGTVIEESWFGYHPNSEAEPDFPEAGVELKATPYIRNSKGISAKERLVCNIINYMTEYDKTFKTSDFWHKCQTILLMSYEHKKDIPKADFTIDKAVLFGFPEADLLIIERDWETIINKIKAGEAHLLTEGDTHYLAACTKGADSSSVRQQPFSDIPAKQRAYSLKSSYMSNILRTYIFGDKRDPNIITDVSYLIEDKDLPGNLVINVDMFSDSSNELLIKDWEQLTDKSLEEVVTDMLSPYYGMSVSTLMNMFEIEKTAKNVNERLLSKMLGVSCRVSETREFKNADIIPKTIRIQKNGKIKESMSFPSFKFTEIIDEEWDTSSLRTYLEPAKFMFVIFRENNEGVYSFERIKFWNIPYQDLEEVRRVWERTVKIIKEGVVLEFDGRVTHNNLPKATESNVAHVRPHAKDSDDTYPLPDGRKMPKQSFWFNNSYLESIMGCRNPAYNKSCSFGCCHKYIECSDAQRCLHDDLDYSQGCAYRQNLESGHIFFGKNRNID